MEPLNKLQGTSGHHPTPSYIRTSLDEVAQGIVQLCFKYLQGLRSTASLHPPLPPRFQSFSIFMVYNISLYLTKEVFSMNFRHWKNTEKQSPWTH